MIGDQKKLLYLIFIILFSICNKQYKMMEVPSLPAVYENE